MLVAHNAPFDIGFLKAACALTGHEWPGNRVLDTARLARQVVTRDEAPNCKLASLARLFRAGTTPDHRALSDARATVDVLHGMLERLGNLGVRSLDELCDLLLAGLARSSGASGTWPRRCRTRRASTCSSTSAARSSTSASPRTCATRVRTYFTAGETRGRMAEMVGLAASVTPDRLRHRRSRPRCASCA